MSNQELSSQHEHERLKEADLLERFKRIGGIDFVTGLPCGELRSFIRQSTEDPDIMHVPVTNEREAVGLATGAWLGGKRPALYMQNSGFFVSSNDIGSLMIPSGIDAMFAISWRGGLGETATQHFVTGGSTRMLIDSFGIPATSQPTDSTLTDIVERAAKSQHPSAVLVERERFNEAPAGYPVAQKSRLSTVYEQEMAKGPLLNRDEAIDCIVENTGNRIPTISSTGLISRSMFDRHDADNHFYNAGGFGLTSVIALGVALANPDTPIISIEGDGSVLTNLGTLNVIGEYSPANLVQIILDNQALVSCSHEPSIGNGEISDFAIAAGYDVVHDVWTKESLDASLAYALERDAQGPIMIHVHIDQDGPRTYRRPLGMQETAERFRAYMTHS